MKKIYLLLAIAMGGCVYPRYNQPITTTQPENNTGYKVSYLFEYGGCKVYRFYDYGNTVYYTNCGGDTVAYADSTQVRSTGFRYNNAARDFPDTRDNDSLSYRIKPIDISPYSKTR
jgi:hypothetical protein